MRIALALVLTACSSKTDKAPPSPPPPPVTHDAAAPTADPSSPCLPASLAGANIAYLRSDGPRVTVCYGNGDDSSGSVTACLVLDEHGEVLGPRSWDDAEQARLAVRELPPSTYDLELEDGTTHPSIVSMDKLRVFYFEEVTSTWRGRFFDRRTDKQIGDVDLSKLDIDTGAFTLPYHLREARWVGTRVIVTDRVEVGPAYHAFIVSSSGDHLALADEKSSYTVIDEDLVVAIRGKELRFVDVDKLAVAATLTAPGASSPLADVLVATFSDHLVVAHARPAGVFFVDRATYAKSSERAIPICPAP